MAKESESEEQPGFEALLAEAEALADKMEEGGLTLEESMKAYEKGVGNLRRCAFLLREAEDKVKLLVEKNGVFRLEDIDEPADGEDGGEEAD
ncbi:MAG: exodeoxyribonuclease VII small subunit [Planctomycetota bacterium]|nr:exodeoxyribonuclease VII small subunit [Planctomycetota bacterium]